MKSLHWKPSSRGRNGASPSRVRRSRSSIAALSSPSIFCSHNAERFRIDHDIAEFERKFALSCRVTAKRGSQRSPRSAAAHSSEVASRLASSASKQPRVLTRARAQSLSIILHRLPSLDILDTAIRNLDSSLLKPSQLDALASLLPTDEEMSAVAALTKKSAPKGTGESVVVSHESEKFVAMMASMPSSKQRVLAWHGMEAFEEKCAHVKAAMAEFRLAADTMREVEGLEELFHTVLHLGNHMNSGTVRGNAIGFDFDSVSLLKGIRSTDRQMSLLAYAVHVSPARVAVEQHLPLLRRVSRGMSMQDMSAIIEEMNQIVQDVRALKSHLDRSVWIEQVEPFVERGTRRLEEVRTEYDSALNSFEVMATFFCADDYDHTRALPLFALLCTFCQDIVECYETMP